MDSPTNTTVPAVPAIALKLSMFWPANPESWFCQAEVEFALRNIVVLDTMDTMYYYYVVAPFDSETYIHVVSLVVSLLEADRHVKLAALLNETYSIMEDKCAKVFFDMVDLGARKPSEVMDYLLWQHEGETPHFLLYFMLKHLVPPTV